MSPESSKQLVDELAFARHAGRWDGPLADRLVSHIRTIRAAITPLLQSSELPTLTPEALRTVAHACDVFIGFHAKVENPVYVDLSADAGHVTVTTVGPDQSKSKFELIGPRWRYSHGPVCSMVDVALSMGAPISYLEGVVDGLKSVTDRTGVNPVRSDAEFVDTDGAARSLGVPVELINEWMAAQFVPYYNFPGSAPPWFKIKELRAWAKDAGVRRGGLKFNPRIEVVIEESEDAPILDVPTAIRNIIGLRQFSMRESVSGIYFLCDQGDVVYVGQSITVYTRVHNHKSEACKNFDRVFFLPCLPEHLDSIERQMIDLLMPKYNADAATRSKRSKLVSSLPHPGAPC